jgi:hypothetical protein
MKNLVFQIICNLSILGVALDDFILLLCQVWELNLNQLIEHLLLEAKLSDSKVQDTDLYLSLWAVMRIWQGGGQEELECFIV